jgi:dihydrofolate reductase
LFPQPPASTRQDRRVDRRPVHSWRVPPSPISRFRARSLADRNAWTDGFKSSIGSNARRCGVKEPGTGDAHAGLDVRYHLPMADNQFKKPTLTLVVAVADNDVIGVDGTLPWRLPEDMRHFRRLTLGHIVLMGRKTFDSLGKPLPGRENWVLTRDRAYAPAGARTFASLDEAFTAAADQMIMVIGGAEIYRQALPYAQVIELTRVHATPAGDTFFPRLDAVAWQEAGCESHAADERHPHAYSFVTLKRAPGLGGGPDCS